MTTIKYRPNRPPNESDGDPLLNEERRIDSLAGEYIFDPIASLTRRPDVTVRKPAPPRGRAVDDADLEELFGAESVATKFAPRARSRSPDSKRWSYASQQKEESDEGDPDWQDVPHRKTATSRSVRTFFWGICTFLLMVTVTFFVFDFIQPLSGVVPERVSDFFSEISNGPGAGSFASAKSSPDVKVFHGALQSNESVPTPAKQMPGTTDAFMPKTPAASALQLPGTERAGPPVAVDDASSQIVPHPSEKAALLQEANTVRATAEEPAADDLGPDAVQPVRPRLSAAQVKHLLARGLTLLQSGNIASARLVFLRVAAAGDRRGAKGVGMTYDPYVYARLPVVGLTPDRQQAELWYEKAGEESTFIPDLNTLAPMPKLQSDSVGTRAHTSEAQARGSPEWIAACFRKYKSFDPKTGLYTTFSGAQRECQLP